MKKFISIIGFILAGIFYFLFDKERTKNMEGTISNAEKEAELKAKERHEKVRDNTIDTANDIADILDK